MRGFCSGGDQSYLRGAGVIIRPAGRRHNLVLIGPALICRHSPTAADARTLASAAREQLRSTHCRHPHLSG